MNKYIKSEYDNFTKTTSYFIIQPTSQDKEEMIVSMFLAEKLEDNLQYYLGISMTNNFGRSDLTHDPVNVLVDNSKLLTLDYSKTIRNGDYEFYIYKCSSDDIMALCETLSIELRVYRYGYTHKDIDVSQVFQFGARVLVDATEDNSMYSEYLAQYYAQEQLIKQKQEEEERSLREKRELEAKRRKEIEKERREERKRQREIEMKKEGEEEKRKEEKKKREEEEAKIRYQNSNMREYIGETLMPICGGGVFSAICVGGIWGLLIDSWAPVLWIGFITIVIVIILYVLKHHSVYN